MTAPMSQEPKHLEVTLTVFTDDQAEELNAAWLEILSGKRPRLTSAAQDLDEIMERARGALQTMVKAIEGNPGTGQSGRLVRFLAGLYSGNEYHVDLTDLRALDTELANACIDYLNYDRLAKVEVHTHLPGGGRQLNEWIHDTGLLPRLHLSTSEEHDQRLYALSQRLDRERDGLLHEALGDLLARYESGIVGCLRATRPPVDDDRPLIHAHSLSAPVQTPLCGASDGPWEARPFEFQRVSCTECQALLLNP
jgi:hypothetical protein